MANTMVHRGPDDAGVYVSSDRRIGLGFRRLSIIDRSPAGHQPMCNEDGSVWIVFNGEVYNHAALRAELEKHGHKYKSRTDTESIIHGYEQWGADVVHRLRGMFAFAVWDQNKRTLFLARDRIGVKPLYYCERGGMFLFGSEIKAILAHPGVSRDVDYEALYHYLTLAATPAPLTMFKGIRKLEPGHTITVSESGAVTTAQYWDPLFPDDSIGGMSEKDTIDKLRSMLRESIRLRMMSDVPFGVFLSGGLDSTLNVALMSELMDRPVDTFSVAIKDDPRSNELSQARHIAEHYKASHHEIVITQSDFIDILPKVVFHQDEPLADPVCIPLYFVSRLARDNGTPVIQVGEGSDEIFAGYTGYAFMENFYHRRFKPFAAMPGWIKKPFAALASAVLPPRKAEFVQRAARNEELFWGGACIFSDSFKRKLFKSPLAGLSATYNDVVLPHYAAFDAARPHAPFLDRIIYLELKQRLAELLLMRVDKMTMATSVEARVPYLDHELVRFALSIPASLKLHKGRTKAILRKAAIGIIPDFVIHRPKKGFCGSATNMMSSGLIDYAEKTVFESLFIQETFNLDIIRPMFAEHRNNIRGHGMALWCLMNLALWHNVWIERKTHVL